MSFADVSFAEGLDSRPSGVRRSRARARLAVLGLMLLGTLGLAGAAPADLSGTWVFDKAQSEVPPNAPFAGGHIVVTQKDPSVRFEMFGADGKPSFTLDFVTDGKPTMNTLGMPQSSAAKWDGDKLVVAWNQAVGAPAAPAAAPGDGPPRPRRGAAPFNWTWKLGAGGKTLINEVEMDPGPNASGEKWVFVRKGK